MRYNKFDEKYHKSVNVTSGQLDIMCQNHTIAYNGCDMMDNGIY